jgi:hypothetical protein
VIRIADVLLDLQKAGSIVYSGWKVSFDCAMYVVAYSGEEDEAKIQKDGAEQRVKELKACAEKMEEDLNLWENEVKKSRSHHYELNYYTTLQLLRLRKELGLVHQNPTKPIDPQILALLESISPIVTSAMVQNVISSLDKELLDLQQKTGENIPVELAGVATIGDAPIKNAELHRVPPTAVEVPSPMTPSENPQLTENDLTDDQRKIFNDLVEYKKFSKLLVLKAFEQLPPTFNLYDIQDWCDECESMHDLEDEEELEQENTASNDENSSDSESERMDVFDQKSKSGWCNYERYTILFVVSYLVLFICIIILPSKTNQSMTY